ncbi:PREDICTED: uncharacterized protein LOC109468085 [Branchiostoma belcheri]|uniref:Uncharacterized protein LOC109468085 n=1 Tax=Branchiostoma belcheri TaxID=7741 RepID=A0A6P4XZ20_BRABE|nr:PREDICTED: uncharacterized protein LOC109468085 [Branchiostoma belcheri]
MKTVLLLCCFLVVAQAWPGSFWRRFQDDDLTSDQDQGRPSIFSPGSGFSPFGQGFWDRMSALFSQTWSEVFSGLGGLPGLDRNSTDDFLDGASVFVHTSAGSFGCSLDWNNLTPNCTGNTTSTVRVQSTKCVWDWEAGTYNCTTFRKQDDQEETTQVSGNCTVEEGVRTCPGAPVQPTGFGGLVKVFDRRVDCLFRPLQIAVFCPDSNDPVTEDSLNCDDSGLMLDYHCRGHPQQPEVTGEPEVHPEAGEPEGPEAEITWVEGAEERPELEGETDVEEPFPIKKTYEEKVRCKVADDGEVVICSRSQKKFDGEDVLQRDRPEKPCKWDGSNTVLSC